MKTSYILIGIVLVVVAVGGVMMFRDNNEPQTSSPQSSLEVMYGDGGYSPGELKIKKGEAVTFKNESSQPMWTASAIHPTHGVYPGTSIAKCSSVPMGEMFDSCAGTSVGSTWMFQFNEAGEWGYHNHLRPNHWGKVIVE